MHKSLSVDLGVAEFRQISRGKLNGIFAAGKDNVDARKGRGVRYSPRLMFRRRQGSVLEAFFALTFSAGGMVAMCKVASRRSLALVRVATGHEGLVCRFQRHAYRRSVASLTVRPDSESSWEGESW